MYGIDSEDRDYIDKKLDRQKNFLKEFIIDIGNKEIDMLENTYSANLNPKKYFSEINNRVNSIHKYGKDNGLMAVFITITAPSKFHPYRTINKKYSVPNPNYKYKYNYEKGVKEASQILSQYWHKFTSLQVVRKMKKSTGHGLIYFKVYEPHKSGVPHLHAMLYLPKDWVLQIKKKFYEHFKKIGISQLKFKYTWYNDKGGAVAYMMKYITKTFRNAETDIMDDSAYWYIKHRIIRFSSSRTLSPLFLYRKIRYYFKEHNDDYIYISKLFSKGVIRKLFNNTVIEFSYFDTDDFEEKELILYSKLYIPELSQQKYITVEITKNMKKKYKITEPNNFKATFKLNYVKKQSKKPLIPIYFENDRKKYLLKDNNEIGEFIKPVSNYSNFDLIQHFNLIDKNIDDVNLHHYGLVKNEMIKRKFLDSQIICLNDYNLNFF